MFVQSAYRTCIDVWTKGVNGLANGIYNQLSIL